MVDHRLVAEDDAQPRLDVFVAGGLGISRARASALVDEGLVTVNGKAQRRSYKVASGDVIEVADRAEEEPAPPPHVQTLWEDEHLMVVSKPSGVVVHAAPGVRGPTLVDALRAADPSRPLAEGGGPERAGIVHRLDRDVSGLLVVAKTDEARQRLVAAMKARSVRRGYRALVAGIVEVDRGKIDAPIGRHPKHRTRMAVLPEGRPAVTRFGVAERFDAAGCSLLDVQLETGRTHQIRTHLASIGHPIVGDPVYGRGASSDLAKRLGLRRPFLHACRLAFRHPVTGQTVEMESPLPADLEEALEELGR